MNERTEKLRAVLSDEAFVRTLLDAENAEAVQKMLADKGVELEMIEIELMGDMLEGLQEGKITQEDLEKLTNAGELSEDELEQAAGGFFFYEKIYQYTDTLGNILTKNQAINMGRAGRTIIQKVAKVNYNVPNIVGTAICGVVCVAGIGIGVYDAVRRRW